MEKIQDLQLVIHVGPGLQDVAGFSDTCDKFELAKTRVIEYIKPINNQLFDGKRTSPLVAPETLRHAQDTLLVILKTLARTRHDGFVLSLVLFSGDVLGTLLGCVYDIGMCANTVVILHARGELGATDGYTVHHLDEEGCLLDWPYGVLDAHCERAELAGLGFPEVHEIHRQREAAYQAKLKAKGVTTERAMTNYRHSGTA